MLNKDIGFVVEGQDVEIELEAYPFTPYGLVKGSVVEFVLGPLIQYGQESVRERWWKPARSRRSCRREQAS